MTPKWIFEKDAYHDGNTEAMIARCKSLGIPHGKVDFVLFGNADHIKWPFGDDEAVIAYGSMGLIQYINRHKRWYPGSWCDFQKLRCTSYLAHWGKFSVQQNYTFLPLYEVRRLKEQLFHRYGLDDHVFIRPDTNDKIFHGEKVCYEQFEKWFSVAQIYQPAPEQLTMVSTPSNIQMEWRFIIGDRQVVTGSRYVHTNDGNVAHAPVGEHELDGEAALFALGVSHSSEWEPAPMYCLDVCQVLDPATLEKSFKLLECGSINCAGLYKCDLTAVMEVAEKIAMREWSELHAV
jgi:hypothetical protein